MTFSQVSAPAATLPASMVSSVRPAVFSLGLWQVTQYLSRTARCAAAADVSAPEDCEPAAVTAPVPLATSANPPRIRANMALTVDLHRRCAKSLHRRCAKSRRAYRTDRPPARFLQAACGQQDGPVR